MSVNTSLADGNRGDDGRSADNRASLGLVERLRLPALLEPLLRSMKAAWEYLDGQLMRERASPSASTWRSQSVLRLALKLR